MNDEGIRILQGGTDADLTRVLEDFNLKHAKTFTFSELAADHKKAMIDALLKKLDEPGVDVRVLLPCLSTVRILSRDLHGCDQLTSKTCMDLLVRHSGLEKYALTEGENLTIQDGDTLVMIEALKCLCNICLNSTHARAHCSTNGCLEGIVQRLKTYKDPDLPHDIKFFDLRVLFLVTALVESTRARMVHQLHGLTYLMEVLDLLLERVGQDAPVLLSQNVALASEILKILFNLTIYVDKNNMDEEEEAHFMRLVSILHDLLLCETEEKDSKEELTSHTVNLLVNMPKDSYEELLSPMTDEADVLNDPQAAAAAGGGGGEENVLPIEYDGKNMDAILVILNFLDKRLEHTAKGHMKESLSPVLNCLCELSRSNRAIRKFCRLRVFPYLKSEVKTLPEEGNSLRNKLCKLFTNPVHEVKANASDFCFVLCKESVPRFVKYTGYGNAAGLLAQRGLMCGGRGGSSSVYSSESEDSDTEEYLELQNKVNPITGRYEDTPPDPMAGMTDEQKEYEAMELVKQIEKLQRAGVIQPMRIGEDGRPQPVEHLLELLEEGANVTAQTATSGGSTSTAASASAVNTSTPSTSTENTSTSSTSTIQPDSSSSS